MNHRNRIGVFESTDGTLYCDGTPEFVGKPRIGAGAVCDVGRLNPEDAHDIVAGILGYHL